MVRPEDIEGAITHANAKMKAIAKANQAADDDEDSNGLLQIAEIRLTEDRNANRGDEEEEEIDDAGMVVKRDDEEEGEGEGKVTAEAKKEKSRRRK